MKALIVILIVLSVFLLIPVGVNVGYDGSSLTLHARIGLISLKILPHKKKRKKPKKAKPKKVETEIQEKPVKKQRKKKSAIGKDDIFALIKMGLKALGSFRRHLSIDYLRLHYTFASDDPFKTALGYGYGCAAMGSITPLVESAFNIKERDFSTSVDFLAEKPFFDFWITTSIQIWEILYIAAAFGIDFLKHKHRQKKIDKLNNSQTQDTQNRKD